MFKNSGKPQTSRSALSIQSRTFCYTAEFFLNLMDYIREIFDSPWVQAATFQVLQGLLFLAGKFVFEKFEILFVNLMEYVSPNVRQVLAGLIGLLYVMSYGAAVAIWVYYNSQHFLRYLM